MIISPQVCGNSDKPTVAIVGLGYVGLPLAIEFSKCFSTIGFDLSASRVSSLRAGDVSTLDLSSDYFRFYNKIHFTSDPNDLKIADFIIVAVPTPVDAAKRPDLTPLVDASNTVGQNMKLGAVVVFESTVYPGATEEVCIPELERSSGRRWKQDFFISYSPERINPGDTEHTLTRIVKVVSGDTPETLDRVSKLYESIISAGVYRAVSIRVAEAAKVIENTQRDLNVALVNEFALVFKKLGLDTQDILDTAGTKWNFLPFRPGLVGGHCIGVDPYYLTYKASMEGYYPEVILAGRRINDRMGQYVAEQTIKQLILAKRNISGASVILLGIAFKEDLGDVRNSRAMDVVCELRNFGVNVYVHDPIVRGHDAYDEYGEKLIEWDDLPTADAMIVAVAHSDYLNRPLPDLMNKILPGGCFIDVKSRFNRVHLAAFKVNVWRL